MYRMSLESWCHCHWSWDCQAFSDYQMQQMTSNFIDQFGFNDEKFADQDDIGKWVYSLVSLVTQAFCEVLSISWLLGFCKSLSWEVHPVYLQHTILYLVISSTAKGHTPRNPAGSGASDLCFWDESYCFAPYWCWSSELKHLPASAF